jgi:diacylglycerol kinase family enzyme
MKTRQFSEKIHELIAGSGRIRELFQRIDLIMNPAAGTFAKTREYLARLSELKVSVAGLIRAGTEKALPVFTAHETQYPGHARDIIRKLSSDRPADGGSKRGGKADNRLIITAGGDGTHLEALSALVEADEETRASTCVFRIPMGTGNDSADAESLSQACRILSGNFTLSRTGAVKFRPQGLSPFYAFNIGSLGLDAYVVTLTNRFKRVIPGKFYKAMVNVATLFYEPIYGVRSMGVTMFDGETVLGTLEGNFAMMIVGLSGHRTYGDHLKILPTEDNVCAVTTVNLIKKLQIKKLFYTGEHRNRPEVHLARADRLIIDYEGKIPLQLDGEAVWLSKENFPLEVEVLKPAINVLHAGDRGDSSLTETSAAAV